jgi:ribA/ribD-fused uncharacterized protein
MSEAELKKFYKGRSKRPERFTYNEEGDLVIYKKKGGEIDQVITLPTYREPMEAEIEAQEAERREAIAAAEVEFETALRELRALIETGAEPSELLAANKRVAVKDTLLQQARFPVLTVTKGMSFPVKDILFEERRQDYMIQGVQLTNMRPFTLKDMYVREGEAAVEGEEALGSEAAIAAAAEEEVLPPVPTIVFDGTDDVNGFMAWDYRSNITVDGVIYRTAYHAIMAGMANYYGNSDAVEEIMSTKRARKIKYDYEQVGTSEEDWNGNFEEITEKVMRIKFAPGTELAERLLATGETVLGAIIPGDTVYGIGLDATDEGVGNSSNWTGQNKLGQLLERIRAELRESAAVAAPAASKKKKKPTFVVEEEEEAAPMAAELSSAAAAAPAAAAAAMAEGQPSAAAAAASKKKKKPVLVAEEEAPAAADAIVESAVAASIAADSQAPGAAMAAEQPSASKKKPRKLRFVVEEN